VAMATRDQGVAAAAQAAVGGRKSRASSNKHDTRGNEVVDDVGSTNIVRPW
jgi:hypothetical protein